MTTAGYMFGHFHKGRAFPEGAHSDFASFIFIPIILQLILGIYLKLHVHENTIRPWAVRLHGLVGKTYPIIGWTQMLFGAITFGHYCRGDNLGQCLAHYIMVSIPPEIQSLLCSDYDSGKRLRGLRYNHGYSAPCG